MAATSTKGEPGSPDSVRESVESGASAWTANSSLPASQGGMKNTSLTKAGTSQGRPGYKGVRFADENASSFSEVTTDSNTSSDQSSIQFASHSKSSISHTSMANKPDREGFSTDGCETRIVELSKIDRKLFDSQIEKMSNDKQVVQVLPTNDLGHGFVDVWVYFDDLRDAQRAKERWPQSLPGCTTRFVPVKDFVNALHTMTGVCKKTDNTDMSTLAQYELVGQWTGPTEDFSIGKVIDSCLELAKSFGAVRNFAILNLEGENASGLRVEYHKLSHSKKLIDSTGLGHSHKIDKNIQVTVKQHQVSPPQSTALVVQTPHAAEAASQPISSTPAPNGHHQNNIPNGYQTDGHAFMHQGREAFGPVVQMTPSQGHNFNPAASAYSLQSLRSGPGDVYRASPSSQMTSLTYPFRRAGRPRRDYDDDDGSLHAAQSVDIACIENGLDVRTTIMIRNIPNRFGVVDVYNVLAATSKGHFDFLYVRMDFSNSCNVGYGFVNFVRPELIIPFLKARIGKPWPGIVSDKVCEVSYATSQGQDCLVQKFRNSSVMLEYTGFRPKLFYNIDSIEIPQGKQIGDEMAFPPPDNRQKLARSVANAQTIGLYPPRGAKGNREARRPRTQWDRGTPGALRDEAMSAQRGLPPAGHYYGDGGRGAYLFSPVNGARGGYPNYGPVAPPMDPFTQSMQQMSLAGVPRYLPDPMQAYHAAAQATPAAPAYGYDFMAEGNESVPPKYATNYRY